jgi:hypothetical protein
MEGLSMTIRRARALAMVVFLVACGSHAGSDAPAPTHAPTVDDPSTPSTPKTPADAEGDANAPTKAAPLFSRAPQIPNQGGGVVANPRFVAVTFAGDELAADLEKFMEQIGGSHYWKAVTSEYGIGPGTAGAPVRLPTPAPSAIDQGRFDALLETSALFLGGLDEDTVYTFFFPENTQFTNLKGLESCTGYSGFHQRAILASLLGQTINYAIVARCPLADFRTLDLVTTTAAHELAEAVTDPTGADLKGITHGWTDQFFVNGGITLALTDEVGDYCWQTYPPPRDASAPANVLDPTDSLTYTVQRSWSNAAARAGHDPCVPAFPNRPYFTAFPVADDAVMIGGNPSTGLVVPKGTTKRLAIQLAGEPEATKPWNVQLRTSAADWAPKVKFAFDGPAQGMSGDTLFVNVTNVAVGVDDLTAIVVESLLPGDPVVRSRQFFAFTGG